jgi:hypothetical protein
MRRPDQQSRAMTPERSDVCEAGKWGVQKAGRATNACNESALTFCICKAMGCGARVRHAARVK